MRSIWKGAVSFGLVTIPIAVFSATEDRSPRFRQLRKGDHSPVRYKRVAEVDGQEVGWEDIERGYEVENGAYVVFTDEELAAATPEGGRLIDVVQFVDAAEIDPIFYKSSYYLGPEKTGVKAYRILLESLAAKERVGIAYVTFRDKRHLAVIRPRGSVLVLETMHWPDEVRAADLEQIGTPVDIRPEELHMAEMLVENLTKPFDATAFADTTRLRIEELARRKLEGEEIVAPSGPEPAKVVDLLEALKASVDATKRRATG